MKIDKKIAYPFIIVGAIGWASGFVISLTNLNTEFEIPMGAASAFTVDSKSNIYMCSQFYSTVQVYNKNGEFIRNWRIPSAGGDLNIDCKNDTIEVFSAKVGAILKFDIKGKLYEKTMTQVRSSDFRENPKELITKQKDKYHLNNGMIWPVIEKNGISIVRPKIHLWFFQGPAPAFLFAIFGMGILAYVNRNLFGKIN